MREIVNLQIGGCGNQIGNKFWEAICQEHGIDKNGEFKGELDLQFQRLNVFFNQSSKGRYTSRSIITDLEPGVADSIRAGPFAALFDSENYVLGQNGAGNNWAKGYYTDGSELSSSILDVIRKEAEECDHLQGFQVLHSLGGGTGSGLGSLLIQKIKQEYSDKIIANFSVFPSQKVSDTIVQPYNATFSTSGLIYNSDFSVVIDNQNLFNICSDILKISKPTYGDLNHLISTVMTGITCCLRFPGQLNSDLRKLAVNLVPFPRQHFFSVGFAPFIYKGSEMYRSLSVLQLSQQMFLDPKVVMCSADPRHGRYFTGSAIFRGNFSTHQIEQQMRNILNKNSSYFMQWIPNNIKYSLCKVSSKAHKNSVTFLGNSTATQQVFKKTIQNFNSMYRRRAFVHWYTNQGLQQIQFTEAESNLNDLISEHQQYVDYTGQYDNEEQFQDW